MIYDIFSFNNELDMLELRLNILDPYVDKFVLIEANKTFSGVDKPLYYEENKERFVKFHDKIIHHKVLDSPKNTTDLECDREYLEMAMNSDNVTHEHICWLIEFYQKEHIKKALVNLNDDDICYVCDLDEIWNYDLNLKPVGEQILKPMINNCYIEYLNVRTNENWTYFTGPIVTMYKNIKNECLNHLRTRRKTEHRYTYIENGGWHFNALGGVQKKIEDFKHPVYHQQYMEWRKSGYRFDETGLPEYIIKNKKQFLDRGLMLDGNKL